MRQVTAEVVTVDGVEQSRTVLSAKVTQEPVTQVVVVGAKTYSAGTTAGDGKATGRFIWPVPGYTNIYSPYGYRWGKLHAGIDISQNGIKGAAIVAADGGRVVEAIPPAPGDRGMGITWSSTTAADTAPGTRTAGKSPSRWDRRWPRGSLSAMWATPATARGITCISKCWSTARPPTRCPI